MGEKILKSIAGKPKQFKVEKELKYERVIIVNLDRHDRRKYVVVKKDLPPGLPKEWDGRKISWFNNFGIRVINKDGTLGEFADIHYTIYIEKEDPREAFVYFDGKTVQDLKVRRFGSGNWVWAALDIGDPPLGGGIRPN